MDITVQQNCLYHIYCHMGNSFSPAMFCYHYHTLPVVMSHCHLIRWNTEKTFISTGIGKNYTWRLQAIAYAIGSARKLDWSSALFPSTASYFFTRPSPDFTQLVFQILFPVPSLHTFTDNSVGNNIFLLETKIFEYE